ncbi:MAG: hypothetical protein ABJ251_03360 [Paracoccaceae bacterium]
MTKLKKAAASSAAAASAAFSTNASALAALAAANTASSAAAAPSALAAAAYSAAQSDRENKMQWPKLWHSADKPLLLAEGWIKLKAFMEADPKVWGFWLEWYEGILNGTPLPWDLTFEIATTLTKEDWDAGAAHVAERIQEIEAKLELERKISTLEHQLNAYEVEHTRHGIGGNNPPEDMQIEPQIVRETTIIWTALDDLKGEADKDTPDKSAVLRIIETLGRALKAILLWVAQKSDLGVDTLIKWGIPLGGAAVLANPKLVADVIEAAKAWVPYLP